LNREHGRSFIWAGAFLLLPLVMPEAAEGQTIDNPMGLPDVRQMIPPAADREGVSATLKIFVLMTVLSLAPAILVMMTSFTRIIIVLALLRQALGTQQLPPGQVLTGLALLLTFVVMAPTWQQVNSQAITPYLENQIDQATALDLAVKPVRTFMIKQIETVGSEEDVYMFLEYAQGKPVEAGQPMIWQEVPTLTLVPSFILSELKAAFLMGFRIYLPFLVVDMVIASILISMGMMMLPPVLISLPFKILLFVLVDGWHLVVGSLLQSFA
jgi:flagellar biosynthetic protein FliP